MRPAAHEDHRVIEGEPVSNNDALEAFMKRYGRAVGSYLLRRGANPGEVEDLRQEVFAALLRRSDLQSIENVEAYLFRTARNLLVTNSRRSLTRPVLVTGEVYEGTPGDTDEMSPERIAVGRERYRLFLAALQELSERQRTIVILGRFEDFHGTEIAAHLGISLSLVEKEMRYALRYLKGRLA
jgi:RNA polymerase sigma-70 factor (ECF subfamily)